MPLILATSPSGILPSVSFDLERGLAELRSLYEHLQTRILEMIETLDDLRASAEMEIFRAAEEDEQVIGEFFKIGTTPATWIVMKTLRVCFHLEADPLEFRPKIVA